MAVALAMAMLPALSAPANPFSGKIKLLLDSMGNDRALELHLYVSDGVFSRSWAVTRGTAWPLYVVETSGLTWNGEQLKGDVSVRGGRSVFMPHLFKGAIEARIRDGRVEGTHKGEVYYGLHAYRPGRSTASYTDVGGTVTGSLVSEEDLRKRYGLAPGQDYPNLRGPTCSGSAPSQGLTLVKKLSEATPVWRSEEHLTGGYYQMRGVSMTPFGGFASPIVYGGRVYVYYFEGAGERLVRRVAEAKGIPGDIADIQERAEANDILLCVDAATGRTIWKFVRKEGLHPFMTVKRGPHVTPCAAYGKVFMLSPISAKAKCLDAETGEQLWEHRDFYSVRRWEGLREQMLRLERTYATSGGHRFTPGTITCSPNYADGVFAYAPEKGRLIAVDAETGRELWRCGRYGIGGEDSIMRWTHQGREYFLSGGTAFEARTGRRLWELRLGGHITAVWKDYLFHAHGKVSIYRLTPEKATLLHELPPDCAFNNCNNGCAIAEGYAFGVNQNSRVSAQFISINLSSGEIVCRKPAPRWSTAYFPLIAEGRLFGEGPSMLRLEPGDIVPAGAVHSVFSTAPYMANGTSCAYSDGRIFFRENCSLMCYDMRVPEPEGAWISKFLADSVRVAAGSEVKLSWRVLRSDAVTILPGIGEVSLEGSMTIVPEQSTVYRLTASGEGETVSKTLRIDVTPVEDSVEVATVSEAQAQEADAAGEGLAMHVYRWPGTGPIPPVETLKHLTTKTTRTLSFTLELEHKRTSIDDIIALTSEGNDLTRELAGTVGVSHGDEFVTFASSKNVLADFMGYVDVPDDGMYTFFLMSAGESTLYVGDNSVVVHDGRRGQMGLQEHSGRVALKKGLHALRILYARGGGSHGALIASWMGPGFARTQLAGRDVLRHTPEDLAAVNKPLPVIKEAAPPVEVSLEDAVASTEVIAREKKTPPATPPQATSGQGVRLPPWALAAGAVAVIAALVVALAKRKK